MSIEKTYIQYGVPSDWAHQYNIIGISAATFKNTSKKNLINKYNIPEDQIDFVKECLVRQPIDEDIVQELLENNRFVCCLCKGQKSDAYIIHHIVEYSKTKDNSYSNLAVLCPNDHDLAHRTGIALTNKISENQIRKAKENWENQVRYENEKKANVKSSLKAITNINKVNVFKELQSYTESDKDYFFGRKEEIEELLLKINKYKIVGLFGESGTGKTSLVNAGLMPQFKDEGFIVISVRCLDEPVKRIREELIRVLKENKVFSDGIVELAATDSFPHFIIKLKSILDKENRALIIIVDQFEEIFTRANERERENLAKGITELLTKPPIAGKLYFLISLREDFIGELWDWSHLYKNDEAWIQQYRIKRFDDKKAFDVIVEPLHKLGIKYKKEFILQIISELKSIGNNYIYPPYLQIVCSNLIEEYKRQNSSQKSLIEFGFNLYNESDNAESIIAEYLSDSMLVNLTEEEKVYAQNILDLLTGPEGLRTFLSIKDISRYLMISEFNSQHVVEHLIKKKIVHPVIEEDRVIGYELVHDFLSKKFFDKLGIDAQRAKTTIEIFRKAFREWKQHGVLASQDRLEILFPNIDQLLLDDDEWFFLIKSSFSVYWYSENKWSTIIKKDKLYIICVELLKEKDEKISSNAIKALGKLTDYDVVPLLIEIIKSDLTPINVRDIAIFQFAFYLTDSRIVDVLKDIIIHEKSSKLRKAAVYALGRNIIELAKSDNKIIKKEINILFQALNDSKTEVRKQAADVLSFDVLNELSLKPLIQRLQLEYSISSRKAIISAINGILRKGKSKNLILPILRNISLDNNEDYRVREEARYGLTNADSNTI